MDYYIHHALLLLECFNVVMFATLGLLCVREWRVRKAVWGGPPFTLLCFDCSLALLLDLVLKFLAQRRDAYPVGLLQADTAFMLFIPTLGLHAFVNAERGRAALSKWWGVAVAAIYCAAIGGTVARALLLILSPASRVRGYWTEGLFVALMLATGGAAAMLFGQAAQRACTREEAAKHRWLLAAMAIVVASVAGEQMTDWIIFKILVQVSPAVFAFVLTYWVQRFAFFDIFFKRLAFFFLTLGLIGVYFVFVPPWVRAVKWGSFQLLAWSMSVWPIVIVVPWAYARLSRWLDATFLGRRCSVAEAGREFLTEIKGAIAEPELVEAAQRSLARIFQCEARIEMAAARSDSAWPAAASAPFPIGEHATGRVCLRQRGSNIPFLSEDFTLLSSLAESFAFLLENLRLRERRLDQERREKELRLLASRSELKALRAEINPHFLFNALSAIAALIRPSPDRAEATVEQLAEVFRYTLRRSGKEWVRLAEELEFMRAYLDIEQARFGARLRVLVSVAPEAERVWIPVMTLQVLVENAVRHGVAMVRGQGAVEIRARIDQDRLIIEVLDNGPGFPQEKSRKARADSGYGLRNVDDRLKGYFGERAELRFGRTADAMTIVTVELPAATMEREEASVS
jgi:two-component sensor histidine kinase